MLKLVVSDLTILFSKNQKVMSASVPECLNSECPTLDCVGPIYPDDPNCTEWRCTASEECEEVIIHGPTLRSTRDESSSESEAEDDELTMDVEGESEGWGYDSEAAEPLSPYPFGYSPLPPASLSPFFREIERNRVEEYLEAEAFSLEVSIPPRRPVRTASSHSGIAPPPVIDLTSEAEEEPLEPSSASMQGTGSSLDPFVIE